MNGHNFDMYYDNPSNRSPTSNRQGTLHRQTSRNQFESQAYLPSGLYTAEDHAQFGGSRFNDIRNATISGAYANNYDMGGQSWNPGAFGGSNTLNGLGGAGLRQQSSRGGRGGIPSAWMDSPQQSQMNHYGGPNGLNGNSMGRQDNMRSDVDEELIPTAIVIKNIPFAIKKEQLVQIMTDMGLPLPYAFNYHFDSGVFRGLAFANFTEADETAAVIDALNHFELNGRKLRVEYKKMLPAAERERIEREKRERRGQLEEQHRPMAPQPLQTQASASSLSSRVMNTSSPSPNSARNQNMGGFPSSFGAANPSSGVDVDLNNPEALQHYSRILLFKEDATRDLLVFPPTLSPPERRIVHTIAHNMGLAHMSRGEGDRRAVHVYKEGRGTRLSPPMPTIQNFPTDQRRALNRAATTDFSDVRDSYYNNANIRTQASSGYLGGYQDTSGGGLSAAGNNLRAAKSFADLRSYTPSPVPSTASFPAALSNNVARLQDFSRETNGNRDSNQASTPTLMTPTSGLGDPSSAGGLINGLGNMSLGPNAGFPGSGNTHSPRALRGFASWDRENTNGHVGPIGGHRSFSTNFDERGSGRTNGTGGPERQPRGPIPERGSGFAPRRQNGHVPRNSDELSQQSSSAAETNADH